MFNLTFLDITQFAAEPLRTGVQRVLIKIIQHLPKDRIMPFRVVDAEHVAILDPAIFECCIAFFQNSQPSARERAAAQHGLHFTLSAEESLIRLIAARPLAVIQAHRFFRRVRRILNLEAFVNIDRSRFYISCPSNYRHKIYHLIHDFLPFEAPEAFPQLNWRYAADYLALFEAYSLAGGYLVSTEEMAQKVCAYFGRREEDVQVVHFGGDITSDLVASQPHARRRRVVMLGTIEPRKYPLAVVRALDELVARQPDVECMVIGYWGWVQQEIREEIETILRRGRVAHLTGVGDVALASLVADTDVAIYVSSTEGFGLPVIEFASLGIPVVTNRAVPSSRLVSDGAIVLDEITQSALLAAVTAQLARGRCLPYYKWTWADCGREIMLDKSVNQLAPDAIDPVDDLACWRISVQLMRETCLNKFDWEALKIEVRKILFSEIGRSFGVFRGPMDNVEISNRQDIVEKVSEVVSDNRNLVYWADLLAARPLLAEVMRSMLSLSYLDGLMHAYIAFVGRPIDARAASEAVRLSPPVRRLERITELINSNEALDFLGKEEAGALRSLLTAVNPVLIRTFGEFFDLSYLLESLGMAPPSVEDICMTEKLVSGSAHRLDLLLRFGGRRKPCGDEIDLLLEAVAQVALEGRSSAQVTAEVRASAQVVTDTKTGIGAQPRKRADSRNPVPLKQSSNDFERDLGGQAIVGFIKEGAHPGDAPSLTG